MLATEGRGKGKQSWDICSRYSDSEDGVNKKSWRESREQWILMKMKIFFKTETRELDR